MTVHPAEIQVLRSMIIFLGGLLFLSVQPALNAQEPSLDEVPGLRDRAVIMHIVSRIVEQNQEVVWNSENSKVTIPGRPVSLKLVGDNLVVVAQFTPFLQDSGQNILVAQAQIWINVPNQGINYNTTMQTIPLQFGEQVYFFPLGSMDSKDEARIEIQLVLEPYAGKRSDTIHQGRDAETRHRPDRRPAAPLPDTGANTTPNTGNSPDADNNTGGDTDTP